MPYPHSAGSPDIAKVLRTGDPRWATRAPARSRNNRHSHLPVVRPRPCGTPLLVVENALHGSKDSYYKTKFPLPCNCVVLPVTDPRIAWKYDPYSARQCARPYVAGGAVPPAESSIVKVARRYGRPDVCCPVHPTRWKAIQDGTRAPPATS